MKYPTEGLERTDYAVVPSHTLTCIVTAPQSLLFTHVMIACCQPKTRLRATWSWGTSCCPSSAKAWRPSLRRNCTGASRRKWSKSPRRSWKLTRWHMRGTLRVIFSPSSPFIALCKENACYPTSRRLLSHSVLLLLYSKKDWHVGSRKHIVLDDKRRSLWHSFC